MSDDVQVSKVLDLKGPACPMPVVKVSKGIKDVAVGEVIEAQTPHLTLCAMHHAPCALNRRQSWTQ